jgi:hypothetical protein
VRVRSITRLLFVTGVFILLCILAILRKQFFLELYNYQRLSLHIYDDEVTSVGVGGAIKVTQLCCCAATDILHRFLMTQHDVLSLDKVYLLIVMFLLYFLQIHVHNTHCSVFINWWFL